MCVCVCLLDTYQRRRRPDYCSLSLSLSPLMDQTAVQQLCAQVWENVCVRRERGVYVSVWERERAREREPEKSRPVIYAAPPTSWPRVSAEVCWREKNSAWARGSASTRKTRVEWREATWLTCFLLRVCFNRWPSRRGEKLKLTVNEFGNRCWKSSAVFYSNFSFSSWRWRCFYINTLTNNHREWKVKYCPGHLV